MLTGRNVLQLGATLLALAAVVGCGWFSLRYASGMARTWDEVDFALALRRFDLLAMQPHFPGYPYFILGGMAVHRWIADPARALAVWNAIASLSAAFPMALLARRWGGGWMFAALALTAPYLWLMDARPMSEGAGIAALWWFLWSVRRAMEQPRSSVRHVAALLLFSVLMGIRLSFFPFGLALVPLLADRLREGGRRKGLALLASVAAAGAFQLVWVAGLAASEGSPAGFWKLSLAFVQGHFSEWGGSVVSTPMPLPERIARLFGDNLVWQALLAHSAIAGALLALLLATVAAVRLWLKRQPAALPADRHAATNRRFARWLAACVLLYALWALLGQNIEKPRHIAPLVGPLLFFAYAAVVRTFAALREAPPLARFRLAAVVLHTLLPLLLAVQFVQGAALLKRQAQEQPAVYQLHDYLRSLPEPFVLYTWEETRVLEYVHAAYEHDRIYTYARFLSAVDAQPTRRVLLTNHVLQGFADQGIDWRKHAAKLATFRSDPLFDPAYAEIELYEWKRE